MKKIILLLVLMGFSIPAHTQQPSSNAGDAMKKLSWWVGQWKGESWAEHRPGQKTYTKMTETVQTKLGGSVLLVEGLGKRKLSETEEGEVVHDALAVVYYDAKTKSYRWRAWREPGNSYTDTELKLSDRALEWSMPMPQGGFSRFKIQLNDKGEWFETGEYSQDGKTWIKFFEMTLRRVS